MDQDTTPTSDHPQARGEATVGYIATRVAMSLAAILALGALIHLLIGRMDPLVASVGGLVMYALQGALIWYLLDQRGGYSFRVRDIVMSVVIGFLLAVVASSMMLAYTDGGGGMGANLLTQAVTLVAYGVGQVAYLGAHVARHDKRSRRQGEVL